MTTGFHGRLEVGELVVNKQWMDWHMDGLNNRAIDSQANGLIVSVRFVQSVLWLLLVT